MRPVWDVRVGGDDGELRPWHYIYVYIEREFIDYKTSMITDQDPLRGLLFY